jgi:hypothetical protein
LPKFDEVSTKSSENVRSRNQKVLWSIALLIRARQIEKVFVRALLLRDEELLLQCASLAFRAIYDSIVDADLCSMDGIQTRDRDQPSAAILRGKAHDTEIAKVLAVALAMGADRTLKETLRSLSGAPADSAFAVSQPNGSGWLTVGAHRVVAGRHRPEGLAVVEEDTLRAHGSSIARAMADALAQSTALADAAKLVRPLLGPTEVPTRQSFVALLPWTPALEQIAYKTAASIAVTLDVLRPYILANLRAGEPARPELLRQYWQRMHAAAQFFLLASEPGAAPWLGEMAGQFAWINWTPTFTLLRERTVWLAACAARSAAAFGEPVVERYLSHLGAASHPFKIFDALFGLTAIVLGNPALSAPVAGEVRSLRRLSTPTVRQIYDDAIDVIEGTAKWAGWDAPEIEVLGWKAGSSVGLATPPALRADPAVVTRSGHLLGFVILPTVFATPMAHFNPVRRIAPAGRQSAPADVIQEVVSSAWGASPPKPARVLH